MRYAVHNVVRARTNRALRAAAPAHLRLVQYVAGRRVLRGRPLLLSGEELERLLPDLQEKAQRGAIEVRTEGGRRVDLATLVAEPAHAAAPAPTPPPDSLAKDDLWGEKVLPPDVPAILAESSTLEDAPRVQPDIPPALPPQPAVSTLGEPKLPALLADAGREEPDPTAPANKRGKKR
jgi:hypothetical protein